MNNTLSWNNHIDLLVKKLSKGCYIIQNAQTYISAPSLKMIYYAFFYSVMSYGIIFWGNSWHSSIIFRSQKKRSLELWKVAGIECHVEAYLRNFKFCLLNLNTGLSKKMDGIWNRCNLKSTGRIYTFGVLKCSEKFKVLDLP